LFPADGKQKEVRGLPKSKRIEKSHIPQKTLWHPYSLQSLTPEKFIQVVNLILKGEHLLLRFNRENESKKIPQLTTPQEKLPE